MTRISAVGQLLGRVLVKTFPGGIRECFNVYGDIRYIHTVVSCIYTLDKQTAKRSPEACKGHEVGLLH